MFILLAVVDGQRNLAVLGHHTQQGGDPHPENSAGAADGDSACHTGDIAGADGSCQGGADRLKRGDGAATSLGGAMEQLTDGILPHGAELAELEETGADTEVQTHAEDEHHGGHTPHDAIDGRIDTADGFKHLRYFLSLHNFLRDLCGKGYKKTPPPLHFGIRTKAKNACVVPPYFAPPSQAAALWVPRTPCRCNGRRPAQPTGVPFRCAAPGELHTKPHPRLSPTGCSLWGIFVLLIPFVAFHYVAYCSG